MEVDAGANAGHPRASYESADGRAGLVKSGSSLWKWFVGSPWRL